MGCGQSECGVESCRYCLIFCPHYHVPCIDGCHGDDVTCAQLLADPSEGALHLELSADQTVWRGCNNLYSDPHHWHDALSLG